MGWGLGSPLAWLGMSLGGDLCIQRPRCLPGRSSFAASIAPPPPQPTLWQTFDKDITLFERSASCGWQLFLHSQSQLSWLDLCVTSVRLRLDAETNVGLSSRIVAGSLSFPDSELFDMQAGENNVVDRFRFEDTHKTRSLIEESSRVEGGRTVTVLLSHGARPTA